MPALVDAPFSWRNWKVGVVHGGESLNGVGQGVDTAVGSYLGRTRNGHERIDDCYSRPKIITQYADLDLVIRVGKHRSGGDFRAGPGRRRYTNQRQDRTGDFEFTDVV